MKLTTQPYKGARDFYPEDKRIQKYMFSKLRAVTESFGYQEYDAPILEPLDIYLAKSGEEIVNEQLYSFEDRKGRKVAIRPEMTPSVSRMVAARRQELAYPLRLYSIPNLWRYERPQAGRLREHWQLNVDLFGVETIAGDHEIILIAAQILKAFGAKDDMYEIRLGSRLYLGNLMTSLGLSAEQKQATIKLIDKSGKTEPAEFKKQLTAEIGGNKADKMIAKLDDKTAPAAVSELLSLLKTSGVRNAVFDATIARGLDYYTDIVFEVYDKHPDNNRSMFGGGRYDGLVGLFGVDPIPTVGFGMGDVTLQRFLEVHKLLPALKNEVDATVILIGDVYKRALEPLEALRKNGAQIAVDSSGRKLDAQLKNAVKSSVPFVIFLGDEELKNGKYKLRNLKSGEEMLLSAAQVAETLQAHR